MDLKKTEIIFKYLIIGIVGLFITFVLVQSAKPFVLDEIDFPIVSKATSETGSPVYYRGEETKNHIGIYHPTLYINSLALFVRVFGFNEVSVRLFGLICTLAAGFLLILISRFFFKEKSLLREPLFLGLFLLNPYTIANATLPDIDSTVLPVTFLLFIYLSLKFVFEEKKDNKLNLLLMALVFTLNLWAKLTIPILLPIFLFFLLLSTTKNLKESVVKTSIVAFLGSFMFVATYYLYCVLLSLPFEYTFNFLIHSFTKGTSSNLPFLTKVLTNLDNYKSFIFWPTIPLTFVYLVSTVSLFLKKGNDERIKAFKILSLLSIFILVFYLGLISPFGGFFKYPFPIFGLMILNIVWFFEEALKEFNLNWIFVAIASGIGFLVENFFYRDSMFQNFTLFYRGEHLLVLVALVIFILNLKKFKYQLILKSTFVLAIFFALGFQISISRIQARAKYPTKYNYGMTGFDESVNYLRANTKKDEVIWGMKDVGYYVNNKYLESYSYYFREEGPNELRGLMENGKIRYFVASYGIGQDRIDVYKEISNVLQEKAALVAEFNNYVIYEVKK